MAVVPGTDAHGVDVRVGKKLMVIGINVGDIVFLGLGLGPFFLQVADGCQDSVRILGIGAEMHFGNGAGADNADADFAAHVDHLMN
ncbi:hypothetical protein D3C76_1646660 [compost metagenome]